MADTKITAMTDAGPLAGGELIPIVKGGINYRTTASAITALVPTPPTTTGLTATYVGYGDFNNLLSGAASLTYDVANAVFKMDRNLAGVASIEVKNPSTNPAARAEFNITNNVVSKVRLGRTASSFTPTAGLIQNEGYLINESGPLLLRSGSNASEDVIFQSGLIEKGRIYADSYGGIGLRSTFSGSNPYSLRVCTTENLDTNHILYLGVQGGDRVLNLKGNFTTAYTIDFLGTSTGQLTFQYNSTNNTYTIPSQSGILSLNPLTTIGDMVVSGAAGVELRLPSASVGTVLTSNGIGVAPSWQALPAVVTPTLTSTQVAVGNASNQLSSSAELFYDTFGTFGITKARNGGVGVTVRNDDAGTGAAANFTANNGTSFAKFFKSGGNYSAGGFYTSNQCVIENSTGSMLFSNTAQADMLFVSSGVERFRVYGSGANTTNAIGIPSAGAGVFNLKINNTETLTATRLLTIGLNDADRSITIPSSGVVTIGGMRYLGDYNAGTNYVLNDVVSYGGNTYLAPGPLVGQAPPTGWTQVGKPSRQTLTDAATINWNLAVAPMALIGLTANRILAAPTNMVQGATYALQVNQDATGSRLLTWNVCFKWPAGRVPLLSTTPNATDIFTFICDSVSLFGVGQMGFA